MTSLQSELKHKQHEHDAIESDISRWLQAGHVIEKLGNTQTIKHESERQIKSFKERK